MHASASDFAGCEQTGNAGASVEIGLHTAHSVMSGRAHGDHVRADVDVVLQAGVINPGKALADHLRIFVRQVEIDDWILAAAEFQFVRDGSCYYIARSEFAQRVILWHEACQLLVAENGTLATKGFRE